MFPKEEKTRASQPAASPLVQLHGYGNVLGEMGEQMRQGRVRFRHRGLKSEPSMQISV